MTETPVVDLQIRQRLLSQPPASAVTVAQRMAKDGVPLPIEVDWIKADLDGSGRFQFLIALFTAQGEVAGYLRVFQQQGGNLLFKGDTEKPEEVGGYSAQMFLVDVNDDGIPEVEVNSISHDGRDHYFSLFSWTGSSLHNMFGEDVMNGELADIDGDGISEIILSQNGGQAFEVYKLLGGDYRLDKTVMTDPTGVSSAGGNLNLALALCSALAPDKFPLNEIRQALDPGQQNGSDAVHFRRTSVT